MPYDEDVHWTMDKDIRPSRVLDILDIFNRKQKMKHFAVRFGGNNFWLFRLMTVEFTSQLHENDSAATQIQTHLSTQMKRLSEIARELRPG